MLKKQLKMPRDSSRRLTDTSNSITVNKDGFKQTEIGLIPDDWEIVRMDLHTTFERVDEPPFKFTEL